MTECHLLDYLAVVNYFILLSISQTVACLLLSLVEWTGPQWTVVHGARQLGTLTSNCLTFLAYLINIVSNVNTPQFSVSISGVHK